MYTAKEKEFYKWLKERFDVNIADASLIAQFLVDTKRERQQLLNKHDVMRWLEFEKQKPEYMQCCLITNEYGSVLEAQYTGESNLFLIGMDKYRAKAWMELPPAFV